ncbi:ATP-binding protein [Nibricoccus sp. IMCC34717]|uniref:ATP-binding protein n=1 Tax=Nibricoccus sp. IMCC34717 TaxID=3034021 RepID=UPI00384EA666
MHGRNLLSKVAESVQFSPATLINGARQTGKSTFLKASFVDGQGYSYLNLDDLNLLRLAKSDPITFLSQLSDKASIDEIQRAPELMLPLKKVIDDARTTKRFLLTGSANILTLPKLSESLAGRMEIHTLWPFSQGEIRGIKEQFIDFTFSNDEPKTPPPFSQDEYLEAAVMGGYPEALAQMKMGRGPEWFKSYLETILQRDIQDISRIEGLAELPNLLEIIASRAGNLINFADVSRVTRLNAMTLKRYYTLLEMVFLVVEVPSWGGNHEKRLVKSPKVFINDSGLLCFLKGLNREALAKERGHFGSVLENFVTMELKKQTGWSKLAANVLHFRNNRGDEVDVVLEAADKRIVGVEVKASMDVNPSDFNGLRALADTAGNRFHRGFLLYTGKEVIKYGANSWALPVAALWQ